MGRHAGTRQDHEGDAVKPKRTSKSLDDFAATHGAAKMKRTEAALAAEQEKVKALSGRKEAVRCLRVASDVIRFGVISDLHVGSLYHHPAALNAYYAAAAEFGALDVLCAGDVLDGWKVYRGQEFELRDCGFDAQLERFANEAPKTGVIETHFICGNHDLSFKSLAGVGVGQAIESVRRDWHHVGDESGRVELRSKSGAAIAVDMVHPGGGGSYAQSYRLQKEIEAIEGGRKPGIYVQGHYHKSAMLPSYRNVCALQGGTFQRQTPFMRRLAAAAHVGGWLVEVQPGDGWNRIRAEFVAFYR
jgi:hypothetical protein